MKDLTAEQKIRQRLTGHPDRYPDFQHEGPAVLRLLTGGTAPSIHAKFQKRDDRIVLSCPQCEEELGWFSADYGRTTYQEIAKIRETGNKHQQLHD